MHFRALPLQGAFVVEPEINNDKRGSFYRVFCKDEFKKINHHEEWLQINHSQTSQKGTIRGLHYQGPPYAEIKLLRCISGAIFDVIVDMRNGSDTFLNWWGVELSSENRKLLYIPKGFAHGFQTLTDNCELIYHHSEIYKPGFEGALKFDDPRLKIDWPLPVTQISDRDSNHPYLDNGFPGINL